jgi:hypothetical protein
VSGDGPRRDPSQGGDATKDDGDDDEAAATPGEPSSASSPPTDADAPSDDREGAPLSDLREDVDERRAAGAEGGAGGDDDFEELFAEMEVGDLDEAEVWTALAESADEPVVDPDVVAEAVAESADADGDTTVVEKSLCHGCPHFADPPETACTHDGTTIEAEVDTEHFRVRECPVVAEREARDPSDFSADPE